MFEMFLTPEEIAILTGRKFRRLQVEALRKMGIPLFVNAVNAPVVARAVIEGAPKTEPPLKTPWVPNVLRKAS